MNIRIKKDCVLEVIESAENDMIESSPEWLCENQEYEVDQYDSGNLKMFQFSDGSVAEIPADCWEEIV